nr:hypothetical protein CFP56_71388 [Quercus suber]
MAATTYLIVGAHNLVIKSTSPKVQSPSLNKKGIFTSNSIRRLSLSLAPLRSIPGHGSVAITEIPSYC